MKRARDATESRPPAQAPSEEAATKYRPTTTMNLRSATAELHSAAAAPSCAESLAAVALATATRIFSASCRAGVNLGQTLAVDDDLDDDEDEYGEEVRSAKKDQAITKYAINVRRQWVERKEAAACVRAEDSDEEEAAPAASSSSNSGVVIPEGAAFVAVERFSGRRAGYVFKRGAKGVVIMRTLGRGRWPRCRRQQATAAASSRTLTAIGCQKAA